MVEDLSMLVRGFSSFGTVGDFLVSLKLIYTLERALDFNAWARPAFNLGQPQDAMVRTTDAQDARSRPKTLIDVVNYLTGKHDKTKDTL